MDKRAAGQYLDRLFGTRRGHVAVAHKEPGSWVEVQFAWPSEKAKLLAWAGEHAGSDVFICPALRRDGHTRKKGDMLPTRWLWVDIDWQGVPEDKRAEVLARIKDLATLVIRSGSGDNLHVYVELDKPVEYQDFIKLNTGLRDYLYGDNKQADNSLLRLPGTTNWKTSTGSVVIIGEDNKRKVTRANLMKRRAFRDAKVIVEADAHEWDYVEIEGLSRRVMAFVTMSVAEATARYGNRHKAVWAITGELSKRCLGPNEIHSLMDKFPAGISKAADENGYDVHRDVDKRLAYDRAAQGLIETDDLEEEAFELATEEDDAEEFERRVNVLVALELERSEARKRARIAEAERSWVPPPDDVSWSLADALKDPPRAVPHLIDGLCGERHNVVITAQYKAGKTAFTMGCIAQALCDGTEFLGNFAVNAPPDGVVVGHWNCEMDPPEMVDDYIRPVGIQNTNNLHVANLRGYNVNILSGPGKAWAVSWLRERKIKVWTIDSFARLCRMAGVSEKDNDEVMGLLMALDQVKVEAEVDVIFLIAHTGRMEHEEGKERARGATAIDDWADARWLMTRDGDVRFLRVEGRGVALSDTRLLYDEESKRSILGFGGKMEVREDTVKDAVVKIVNEQPGIGKTALLTALKGLGISNRAAAEPIEEAIEGGFIEVKLEDRRGRSARCHYPAGSLKGSTRTMKATPADVDLRSVKGRSTRRNRG